MKITLRSFALALLVCALVGGSAGATDNPPLLLQSPSLSATQLVFAYGGEIWITSRDGGEARRLVSGTNRLDGPIFSPDGSMVAYTGNYDGNEDVYVVPATGGQPHRLTYHPGQDVALGWTPDGKRVAFRSSRKSYADPSQLYTVPVEGGFPTEVPLPRVQEASYSPDGTHLAYQPNMQWQPAWKGYRGGQTRTIWVADLADSSIVAVPQKDNSNDGNPMWIGNDIYFLSDRDGSIGLYAYDVTSRQVRTVVPNDGVDFWSASAGPGAIVYSQLGALYLYDLSSGTTKRIRVHLAADMPGLRPHFAKLDPRRDVENAAISPTGQRAVFEAHGEILTVPAEKGDIRDITSTTGAAERDPSWSPDGKWIAYFSDASGEYALHLKEQDGLGQAKVIGLGDPPSFFYRPVWSPDSTKIAYTDKRLNLWYVDIEAGKPVLVDTDRYDTPTHQFDVEWAPDSAWLTYTKLLPSQLHAAYVYSLKDAKSTQVTDGMSDVLYPVFDKSGKYLYFTASTDVGLASGWLDMSSLAHPQTRSVYAVVLRADLPSPIPPESDEEKVKDEKPKKDEKKADEGEADDEKADNGNGEKEKKDGKTEVTIDFAGLDQRIVALPIPPKRYEGLMAGKEGQLLLPSGPIVSGAGPPALEVSRFDLEKRKVEPFVEGVSFITVSADGSKALYLMGSSWCIAPTAAPAKPGKGKLDMSGLRVWVDPRAEWRQMYHEVWRIERDFFYDPNFHGLDLAAAEKAYAPYLDGIASRGDLNVLFREMTGNLSVGHTFVAGGTMPEVERVPVGLLGADYTIENGRYRFAHILNGENWNPDLQAPLTQPGVDVKEGDYLLAVNGRGLDATTTNLFSVFLGTAGRQTVIKVGPNANGTDARDVTVVPVASERELRHLAWVEGNRRKVDELSGGRVAYVYMPNTTGAGFTSFNRYFFAQVGKEAAVIDERYNHGGQLADYIIDAMRRPPMSRVAGRDGEDYTEPVAAIYGPKAMIINQFAGSGGDAMPWYFRRAGIGPLVGARTWGGLVGIGGYPPLMDGGMVTAPRWGIYGLEGEWEVENHGVAPDIEVEQDPALVRQGHDPQLERAVAEVLRRLQEHPLETFTKPAYPVFNHPLPTVN